MLRSRMNTTTTYHYVRQAKLATSLVNFWAHEKNSNWLTDWLISRCPSIAGDFQFTFPYIYTLYMVAQKSKPPPIFQKIVLKIANEIRFLRQVKVWSKHYNTIRWQ